ncbi:MAG: hypothetical protein GY868_01895 [Deltaproteobacteria bacterium]|nr:hypothetical protein [Deltaproteobacteria bacterium]
MHTHFFNKNIYSFIIWMALLLMTRPACANKEWVQVYSTDGDIMLNAVWGSSADDVFAVGNCVTGYGGVSTAEPCFSIIHYDGTAWSTMDIGLEQTVLPRRAYLNDVWGSSADNVYSVGFDGNGGLILHYDGTSWTEMKSIPDQSLNAVWGSSVTDVFAVGVNGTILHYDGTGWRAMESGTDVTLAAVWGSSATDVFVVGDEGTILNYDGTGWTTMDVVLDQEGYTYLNAIWGSSGTDVFVVGSYTSCMLHYNGTAWSKFDGGENDFDAVWGSSGDNIFAVGVAIYHYTGTVWTENFRTERGYFTDIWGWPEQDIFAVTVMGDVYRYVADIDGDGILNAADNCKTVVNPDQRDQDGDGIGDACDICPEMADPEQIDMDADGLGDLCDPIPNDLDNDTIDGEVDNCPTVFNPDQADNDADGFGDVCDQGARFAVIDDSKKNVYIYAMDGTLLTTVDVGCIGTPFFIRDDGSSGWLVKMYIGNTFDWAISHIDSSGAIRNTVSSNNPGPFYTGLEDGSFIQGNFFSSEVTLHNGDGDLLDAISVWTEPDGWEYSYTVMGDLAGLVTGGFVVVPELGSTSLCFAGDADGAGLSPYLYFYDNNLELQNKVDISADKLSLFMLVTLTNGGFAALGNMYGREHPTHLFFFDDAGSLIETKNISQDIPSVMTDCYMNYPITAANDGAVLVSRLFSSTVWMYYPSAADDAEGVSRRLKSLPMKLDLSKDGVASIAGLGGSKFQPRSIQQTRVASFTAAPGNRQVVLQWTTAPGAVSTGFEVYRADSRLGTYVPITAGRIMATAEGDVYEFVDIEVTNRRTYFYKLLSSHQDGTTFMPGTVRSTPRLMYGVLPEKK